MNNFFPEYPELILKDKIKHETENHTVSSLRRSRRIQSISNTSELPLDLYIQNLKIEDKIKVENISIHEDNLYCINALKDFEPIKENIYTESSAKIVCKSNILKCDCTLTDEDLKNNEKGCRFNCINRLLFIECSQKCRCSKLCDNKQFQNSNYSPISVFYTEKKGIGIIADADIPKDSFLIEFVGEIISSKQFLKRNKKYAKEKDRQCYFMSLRYDAIIDATVKGNISRFVNHSCEPNGMTQKWTGEC